MKLVWNFMLGLYLLTLLPVAFLAAAAFAQRNIDPSGDARNAAFLFGAYLIGFPMLLLLARSLRTSNRGRLAE